MKCKNCGGTGKEYWNGNVFCNTGFECEFCHGTGNVEQTNEEWFCELPTKEKAKFLAAQQLHGGTIASRSDVDWEVWLKEIHDG